MRTQETHYPRAENRQPEKRKQSRIHTALPVMLENATGVTRDVSPWGVFFWTDGGAFTAGDRVSFAIRIRGPAGSMSLICRGDIVRTEKYEAVLGVAVRITESALKFA